MIRWVTCQQSNEKVGILCCLDCFGKDDEDSVMIIEVLVYPVQEAGRIVHCQGQWRERIVHTSTNANYVTIFS